MSLRVKRMDLNKAVTNRFVAATFETEAAGGGAPARRLFVGEVEDILCLRMGNQPLTLLKVQWYSTMQDDPAIPGLRRVRVGGAPPPGRTLHEHDKFIEARRIDSQVSLTTIPGQPHWRWVHFKRSSAFVMPEHLQAPA